MTNSSPLRYGLLALVLSLSLVLTCSDEATNPQNNTDTDTSTIIISTTMPQNNSLPPSGIIDTLIFQSHVQLILSSCYDDTTDQDYPNIIYIANDVVKTFAFLWLPENWNTLPSAQKRMLVHLHGHCGIGAKHFCTWYELAKTKNIAVLSLQYWMGDVDWQGGNPSPGDDYPYYLTGPGQTCGWHLNIDADIYPFIDKLAEYYDAHSVMLHGFSMSAATCAIVNYRDKCARDIIDFSVFNAGHMDSSHYFREEIDTMSNPYAGEKFFFFLENIDSLTYAQQSETRSFLLGKGVTEVETVTAVGSGYAHGALLNNDDFAATRERIIFLYDSLTTN